MGPLGLLSRQEADDLSADLIAYAAEHELGVSRLDPGETTASVGEVEYPAISYALVANGTPESLIGLLNVSGGALTAKVETLDFVRDPESQDLWNMTLELVVPYAEKD